jgi:mannose-6-phosphate isomerase-like protein (cupin superfamily)
MSLMTPHRYPEPVDKAQVEGDWNRRGFSCDWMMDSTRREWRDCSHRSNALLAVVDGELEVVIHGEKYVLRPGDEVVVPKGALHHLKNLHPVTTRWLYGFDSGEEVAQGS